MPKRDLRTDKVREFVETSRRHEAMFGIQAGMDTESGGYPSNFYFWF